jgi:hypothetical protein
MIGVVLYYVVSTLVSAAMMMQLCKGCKDTRKRILSHPDTNLKISAFLGWLIFPVLIIPFVVTVIAVTLDTITWEDVWEYLDDGNDDGEPSLAL